MQRTVAWLSPLFLVAPLCLFLLGVQDWRYFFCVLAVNVVVPLAAFYTWRRGDDRSRGIILLSLGLLTTSFGFVVLGPLVHVPSNVLAIAVVFVALSTSRKRLVALPLAVLAILVPLALQLTGVIAPSYAFDDGSMKILPLASSLPQGGTLLYLAVVSVLALCVTLLVVHRQRKQLDGLEERLFFHAWSLQRLVPKGADIRLPMGANAPPSRRPSS
jgi:hypothetical protein